MEKLSSPKAATINRPTHFSNLKLDLRKLDNAGFFIQNATFENSILIVDLQSYNTEIMFDPAFEDTLRNQMGKDLADMLIKTTQKRVMKTMMLAICK